MKTPARILSTLLSIGCIGIAALSLPTVSLAQYCVQPQTYCTAKVSSQGQTPQIGSIGAPEVASNQFYITLNHAPAHKPALVITGTGAATLPFNGGTLCVAPPIVRSAGLITDVAGSLAYHVLLDGSFHGAKRYFQVWFRDAAHPDGTGVGISNGLTTFFALDHVNQIPTAPAGLSGSPVGIDAVQLQWTDQAGNETKYRVAKLNDGDDPNIPQNWDNFGGDLLPNTTSLLVDGLAPGSTYHFKVRCGNDCGESNYSNEIIVTTNCPYLPAPSGLIGSSACIGQVRLDWIDNSSTEFEFRVARLDPGADPNDPAAWHHIGSSPSNVTTFTDRSVQNGQFYLYKVRANDLCSFSDYSNTIQVAALGVPAAPSNCVATRQGNTPAPDPILVTWSHSGQCTSEFRIARLKPNGNLNNEADWNNVGVVAASQLGFIDHTPGPNGVTVWYKVRAALYIPCGAYYSGYSNIDSANP